MADMEIKINNSPLQVNSNVSPVQNKPVSTGIENKSEVEKERQPKAEPELENVVSVSEDGDTVQVTEESSERLEEDAFGKVEVKGENPAIEEYKASLEEAVESPTSERIREAANPAKIDPAKERIEELTEDQNADKVERSNEIKEANNTARAEEEQTEEEAEKLNVTSYTGYTEEQLQRMVREGEISQNDFNREMEARKERVEATIEKNNEFTNEMTEDIGEIEQTERQGEELRTVFSEDSAEVPDSATRADILDKLQDFTLNN